MRTPAPLTPCTGTHAPAGGKTEDFLAAAQLFHKAQRQVKVPTYLVPATQKVRRRSGLILEVRGGLHPLRGPCCSRCCRCQLRVLRALCLLPQQLPWQ